MMIKALIIIFLALGIFGTAGYFTYETFFRDKLALQAEKNAPPTPTPTPPPDHSVPEYRKVRKIKESGDLIAARKAYLDFLEAYPYSTVLADAKKDLGEINTDIFFSQYEDPEKVEYIVKSGDTLNRIASRTDSTTELIMRSNNLETIRINIGDRYLIPKPDFSLTIDRENKTVTLYNKGRFFKEYAVKNWKLPPPRSEAPVKGEVREKIAWKDGKRLRIEDSDYAGSARWVMTSLPGLTLYSAPAEGTEAPAQDIPPGGLGLSFPDMDEIAVLVRRGTPVSLE
jgi:LysM repeat protein